MFDNVIIWAILILLIKKVYFEAGRQRLKVSPLTGKGVVVDFRERKNKTPLCPLTTKNDDVGQSGPTTSST